MPKSKEQKIKLRLLHDLLCKHTDEENPLSTPQIIAMLQSQYGITVGSRALIDDIKLLNEYGYEVRKKHYYFYVDDRDFDISELKILIDAVQAASFIPDNLTERFVAKIAALAGAHRAELLKKNIVCFDTNKCHNKQVFYSVDTLIAATEQKRKVSFLYYGLDVHKKKIYRKNGERYLVNPLALIYTGDKYYLVCYSDKYRSLSNYRIDRMEKVEIESDEITYVEQFENFNIYAYRQQAFSMFTGELKNVILSVDNACIDAILDKFGEQAILTRLDDNTFKIAVKVQVSPTFFAWCLTSCQKIRITSPIDVVKEYGTYIKKVLNG